MGEREREGKRREDGVLLAEGAEGEGGSPQMLDVSVRGTDKAAYKFESRMPTS